MTDVIEKRCDYLTKKLACLKRRDVAKYVVVVTRTTPTTDCVPEVAIYYNADLCPSHSGMLIKGIVKVMGERKDTLEEEPKE